MPQREDDAPSATPAPEERPVQDCSPDLERVLVGAVDGQLAAIRDGRWSEALQFATPGFRADFDETTFEVTIVEGFPVVASSTGRDTGACFRADTGDEATLLVVVRDDTASAQQQLVYLFELTDEGWGIAGALPTDADDQDRSTVTT